MYRIYNLSCRHHLLTAFIGHHVFYPPSMYCPQCQHRLKEEMRHEATLFTLRNGAVAAYITSLYCRRKSSFNFERHT